MTDIIEITDKKLIETFKAVAAKAWEAKYSMRDDNKYDGLPEVKTKRLFDAEALCLSSRISENFKIAQDNDGIILILDTKKQKAYNLLKENPDQIPYISYDPKTNTLKAKNWEDSHGIYAGAYIQRLAKAYRLV